MCDQPKTFFSHGIHKPADRWNMCIEMGENLKKSDVSFSCFVFLRIVKIIKMQMMFDLPS